MNFMIFIILAGAGLLAGSVTFFTVYIKLPSAVPDVKNKYEEADTSNKEPWIAFTGYFVIGLAGAFLVPLLKQILNLKGMDGLDAPNGPNNDFTYWVLLGYGLVFGYATTRSLNSILDPLLKRMVDIENKQVKFANQNASVSTNLLDMATNNIVIDECESQWEAHKDDCSGFVKAVASAFEIALTGLADEIVDEIQTGKWIVLPDGPDAKAKADAGWLVIAGLKGADNVPSQEHGHVAVIVSGPLAQGKYPTGYWGKLGSVGEKNKTINWAWNSASRNKVIYSGIQI